VEYVHDSVENHGKTEMIVAELGKESISLLF
jgi:hypothetical protein